MFNRRILPVNPRAVVWKARAGAKARPACTIPGTGSPGALHKNQPGAQLLRVCPTHLSQASARVLGEGPLTRAGYPIRPCPGIPPIGVPTRHCAWPICCSSARRWASCPWQEEQELTRAFCYTRTLVKSVFARDLAPAWAAGTINPPRAALALVARTGIRLNMGEHNMAPGRHWFLAR